MIFWSPWGLWHLKVASRATINGCYVAIHHVNGQLTCSQTEMDTIILVDVLSVQNVGTMKEESLLRVVPWVSNVISFFRLIPSKTPSSYRIMKPKNLWGRKNSTRPVSVSAKCKTRTKASCLTKLNSRREILTQSWLENLNIGGITKLEDAWDSNTHFQTSLFVLPKQATADDFPKS